MKNNYEKLLEILRNKYNDLEDRIDIIKPKFDYLMRSDDNRKLIYKKFDKAFIRSRQRM